MGEIGEYWRDMKEARREKRAEFEASVGMPTEKFYAQQVSDAGFKIVQLSEHHYRVGDFDFWPSTGKFMNRKTKRLGRGVSRLLALLSESVNGEKP